MFKMFGDNWQNAQPSIAESALSNMIEKGDNDSQSIGIKMISILHFAMRHKNQLNLETLNILKKCIIESLKPEELELFYDLERKLILEERIEENKRRERSSKENG